MQIQSRVSNLPATSKDGHRTESSGWCPLSAEGWKASLTRVLCIWCAAFRSFRGHIRSLFSIAGTRIDLGASCQFQDGHWQANTRTLARAEGIEKLWAIHPWVDSQDRRIFLMGFDAGEEYSRAAYPLPADKEALHIAQANTMR